MINGPLKEVTKLTLWRTVVTERGTREFMFPACTICGAYRPPYQECIITGCAPAESN